MMANRTTARSRPPTTVADVISAEAMSASSDGAPSALRVLHGPECVARDEQKGVGAELRVDFGHRGEIETRDGFLATFMELAVEVGEHLVVDGVQLLLGDFTLGKPASDPCDVQETLANGLLEGMIWRDVAHGITSVRVGRSNLPALPEPRFVCRWVVADR